MAINNYIKMGQHKYKYFMETPGIIIDDDVKGQCRLLSTGYFGK